MNAPLICHRRPVAVLGTGSALPSHRFETPALLEQVSRYLPGRLRPRTAALARRLGIQTRYFSRPLDHAREAPHDSNSAPSMGAGAIRAALAQGGMTAGDLGLLLGHTTTPHTLLPSNAAWIAEKLAYDGPHVELRQACTGFASASVCAAALLSSGTPAVAITGTEVGSVMLDLERIGIESAQLVNLMQMGDGAGAAILGPMTDPHQARLETLFYGSLAGRHAPAISLPQGGSGAPFVGTRGISHFRHEYAAIRDRGAGLLSAGLAAAEDLGIERGSVDWLLPQQVNGRLASLCAKIIDLPEKRIVVEANAIGNVGSAAMWIALDRLRRTDRLREGDRVLALGAEASKFMYGGFLYIHRAATQFTRE